MPVEVEVCIDSVHGALSALAGGVRRLETCAGLSDGGLTPSLGLVQQIDAWGKGARQFVMIRPRGGDFAYSRDEVDVMLRDIEAVKALRLPSVAGFVFGCLTPQRSVDLLSMNRLITAARPLAVTFHRAIDVAVDYDAALLRVVELGCDYLLTSGGRPTAVAGKETIRRAVQRHGKAIAIMAGSGVNPDNAAELLDAGVSHLHFSAKGRVASSYASLSMGSADSGDGYNSASQETVERMLRAVAKL
eukprot:TRINITY_DN77115_c0_g1_i1.p1 TRINITY_DN77115_c0_g1~~TRINITY_DN77115_c0_g1_i1.p1  ORF type:complete len:246 (+),score=90.41 TRINITY_DN77115_c0_g1_i1:113-850(+)